jgi:hypothetical protein
MPIVAVGVAIAADVGAAAAVAGTVGGIAAITTATALEVVAAVGATLGAIGAVTGNKTLSTIGMVVGAVGAIGAVASAAGVFGAQVASSASDAASASGDAIDFDATGLPSDAPVDATGLPTGVGDDISAAEDAAAQPVAGDAAMAATTADNAADPAAGLGGNPADGVPAGTDMAPQDAASLQANTANAAADPTSQIDTVVGENPISAPTGPATPANPTSTLPPGALQQAATQTGTGGADATGLPGDAVAPENVPDPTGLPSNVAAGTSTSTSGLGSILSDISDFTKNHQLLTYGLLQAGGSFLTGLTSSLTPAQVSALNAQAAANNAAAALTAQQTANLAMPKSVANSSPVTGAPQTLVPGATPAAPAATGFINNAPGPVQTQVTGKAA